MSARQYGGRRSIVFPPCDPKGAAELAERGIDPLAHLGQEPAAARPTLHVEPTEGVLVYGLMFQDVATIGELLKKLPFDREYRGSLRVIISAARLLSERATRLLEETEAAS